MSLTTLLLQAAPPTTAWSMITGATIPTKIVLFVLAMGSLFSWWLIFSKSRQFREVRRQGDEFLAYMERAQRLEDAYKAIVSLPDSPYGRVFRQGVNFFSELRPGALREGAPSSQGLTLTQLEALRLVLEKEEAQERDELALGLGWLAVVGSVSPLMGLMGTVIGTERTSGADFVTVTVRPAVDFNAVRHLEFIRNEADSERVVLSSPAPIP